MEYIIIFVLITFSNHLLAQQVEVDGVVVDQLRQEPIIGETISVLGTNRVT